MLTGLEEGPFVVALEGVNGAGKSTIRDHLASDLLGLDTYMVGQHSWLAPDRARVILDVRERRRVRSEAEVLAAHVADRQAQWDLVVAPELAAGRPVIADRSAISDMAYLEALVGIPATATLEAYLAEGVPLPDVVVYVRVDVDQALERIVQRDQGRKAYENRRDLSAIASAFDRLLRSGHPHLPPIVEVASGEAPATTIDRVASCWRELGRA